jgi:hypothetical protein
MEGCAEEYRAYAKRLFRSPPIVEVIISDEEEVVMAKH